MSSFLLTYRLLNDFSISNQFKVKNTFITVLKFFIRRFFRLYLPYVVYCTGVAISPNYAGGGMVYASWTDMVTLRRTGNINPAWTIPSEIKYYFLMPIISLPAAFPKFKNSYLLIIFMLVIINILNMQSNIFRVKSTKDIAALLSDQNENFKICLPYFLN